MIKLRQISISGCRIIYQPSRQCLHGNKAHAVSSTCTDKLQFLLSRQITERKLQRCIQVRFYGLAGYCQTMVSNADETDLPLFPGLLHRFIQAAAVTRFRAKGRIMKLINIYIISLQQAQTGFQVIPESCCCNRRCFSRNKYLLADTL